MFKIIVSVVLFAAVSGQSSHYPAGVDPNLCPNYPHCADPAVGAKSIANAFNFAPTTTYTHIPTGDLSYDAPAPLPYSVPAAIPMTYAAPAAVPMAYAGVPAGIPMPYAAVPAAATHPAGVDPRLCPNYPYCDNAALARSL